MASIRGAPVGATYGAQLRTSESGGEEAIPGSGAQAPE